MAGGAALLGGLVSAQSSMEKPARPAHHPVWCWALDPDFIQGRAGVMGVPPDNFCPAVELVDYFHCRNVAYFTWKDHPHPAESLQPLAKYDRVVANVSHRSEAGRAQATELSQLSRQFPNLVGGIVDDFSTAIEKGRGTVPQVQELRANLQSVNPSLKLFGVCYTMHFSVDLSAYMPYFDVIVLWVWHAADLKDLDAHVTQAARLYRKPLHLGLYLFDYADTRKTLPMETIRFECQRARQYLRDGRIEAIHILSSYTREEMNTNQARWMANFSLSL
jgi:hypothetical protein